MKMMTRDYLQEEAILKEQVGVLHTDLYAFTKRHIMNMDMEQNANEGTIAMIVRNYALHAKDKTIIKNKDVIGSIRDIVIFNDERFSLNRTTFFELEETNPYYLNNLIALNTNYEFEKKNQRLTLMTTFQIFTILQELRAAHGKMQKKLLIDYCEELQTNGAKSTDWK